MQQSVDTYLSVHLLGGEPLDVSDRAGCALLELNSLESLMQMKSVIAASGLHFLFLSSTGHLCKASLYSNDKTLLFSAILIHGV